MLDLTLSLCHAFRTGIAVVTVAAWLCSCAWGQESVSQQLRTQGQLYTSAADTLDSQAATISTQAAKIVELEARIAELRGDLKPSDFSFLGRVRIPSVGMTCSGLAYDPATGWWYTVGAAGNAPFNLYRFKMPTPDPATLGTATQVELVGPINNAADVLKMAGQALVNCKGLLWEGDGKLLINYGSYYANGFNLMVLARFDVNAKAIVAGPWMVDAAISSETVKGMTMFAPPKLAEATGLPLLSFGVRGSTPQKQSHGLGLVALGNPIAGQPTVPASIISHWPMKIWPGSNPVIPYSDYPNDEAYPVVYLQRAADGTVIKTPMTGGAYFGSGCVVKGKFVMAFGSTDWGNKWYGNNNDFQDVPSLIDPTKMTIGNGTYRGGYVESTIDKYWLYRVEDITSKFAAGDKLISHYATGRISDLGGGVPVPLQSTTFGQAVEVDDFIHVICHGIVGGGNAQVLVFKVR